MLVHPKHTVELAPITEKTYYILIGLLVFGAALAGAAMIWAWTTGVILGLWLAGIVLAAAFNYGAHRYDRD